jgi:hypothetical protein
MNETFEINTPGVDVKNVMAGIRERVEKKRSSGLYERYNLSGLRAMELENIKDGEAYLDYYLKTIWKAADIDLGNFPITSKTYILGEPVVWLKKIIRQLLKFYTYRLFSQQKDFNAKTASIVYGINRKFERKISVLEGKIEALRGEQKSEYKNKNSGE